MTPAMIDVITSAISNSTSVKAVRRGDPKHRAQRERRAS
jgi:hypothetical protein